MFRVARRSVAQPTRRAAARRRSRGLHIEREARKPRRPPARPPRRPGRHFQGVKSRASALRRNSAVFAARSGPDWLRQGWNRQRDQWRRERDWSRVRAQLRRELHTGRWRRCNWHRRRWGRCGWNTQQWHRAARQRRRGFAQALDDWRQRRMNRLQLHVI
ncbi:hypothetical protein E5U26_34215 [Burkholderia pseudomallei]|nr:hypothetical protein [Burkholderia pseudomallei]